MSISNILVPNNYTLYSNTPTIGQQVATKQYVDGKAPDTPPVNTMIAYVSVNGTDGVNDGSFNKPWKTITYAINQLSLLFPTPTNQYLISVGPGTYSENVSLRANMSIAGQGTRLTIVSGSLIFNDSSWTSSAANKSTISDIQFTGTVTANLLTTNATNANIVFRNCLFSSTTSLTSQGTSEIIVQDCYMVGVTTISKGSIAFFGSEFLGVLNCNSNSSQSSALLFGDCAIGGGLVGTYTAGHIGITITLRNCQTTSLSLDGASLTCDATVDSIPQNPTITNGATLNRLNYAPALAYSPTTPANWFTVPTSVQSGLDNLASAIGANAYTPTLTNLVGLSSASGNRCRYHKIGNIVFVSGFVNVATNATSGTVDISVPIAPTNPFGSVNLAGGNLIAINTTNIFTGQISAVTGSSTVRVTFTAPTGITFNSAPINFSYEIA